MSVFETLNAIDVNEHIERKGNLSYLSWAWAWAELKKCYPDAQSVVYETPEGMNYWTDGRTAWVKTGVIVEGLEHIEYLPVMDYKNKSIPVEKITSMDVNKTIQRSITKAIARHGLGLYIYAGEDLPEETKEEKSNSSRARQNTQATEPSTPNTDEITQRRIQAKILAINEVCKAHKTTPEKICTANGVEWNEKDEDLLDQLGRTFINWGWQ